MLKHGEYALLLARKLGQQELIVRSLNVLAYAKKVMGDWDGTEALAEEARVLSRTLGNRTMEVDCLCLMANAKINAGRPDEGIHDAQTALEISLSIENAWGQVNSTHHLAIGSLEIGAYTEALAAAERGVSIARSHTLQVLLGNTLTILGKVHRAMFNLDAARAAHLEALAMNEALHSQPFIEMNAAEICADCALTGAWDEAHAYAMKALNIRRGFFYLYMGQNRWYEIEALVRAGEIEHATEDLRHFGESVGNGQRFRIVYLRGLAVLAKFRGEIEQATQYLQEAARLAEEIGLPGELWSIWAALGDLFLV